jgi:hypothetical protein
MLIFFDSILCINLIMNLGVLRVRSVVLPVGCNRQLRALPFDNEKQDVLFDNSDKGIGDQDPGAFWMHYIFIGS